MYDTLLFLNGGTETSVLANTQPWIVQWIDQGLVNNNAPIFDGSLDWHSSIHARLAQVINLEETGQTNLISEYANSEFPSNLVQDEITVNINDTYGVAWLFQLDSKLTEYGASNLSPLADFHFQKLQTRVEARVDSFELSNSINIFGSYGDPNWMVMNAFKWGQDRGLTNVSNWAMTQFDRYANAIDWTNIDVLQGDFFSSVGIAALSHVTMGQTTGPAWDSILVSLENAIDSGQLDNVLNGNVSSRDSGAVLSLSWGMWAAFSETENPAFYRAYEEIIIWADENIDEWGAEFRASGHWLPNFLAFGLDIPTELPVDWSVDLQADFNDFDGIGNGAFTILGNVYNGSLGDDVMSGTDANNVFIGERGDDVIDGNGGAYNQADYDGALSEYQFTQNANGTVTVTHPTWGTDTLTDIDGLWFSGESAWYSMADAVRLTEGGAGTPSGGVSIQDNVYTGSAGDDVMTGTAANNVFIGNRGNDVINGNGGAYNQADYSGALSEYQFTQNANGSVTVTHPTWGTDTLIDIDGLWFAGEQAWYSIGDAVNLTGGLTSGGGVTINGNIYTGTVGNDVMTGTVANNVFIGDRGNDVINGNGGGYNQVDFDGDLSEYEFTQNANGSVTVSHEIWGTDTLTDIDGFWFSGEQSWYSLEDAILA